MMFIGHIPAGYIITKRFLNNKNYLKEKDYNFLLWLGIFTSILPDFDLVYFYLIDNQQHLHHGYWTHLPIYWIVILFPLYSYGRVIKNQQICLISVVSIINIIGHLVLDSIVGKIRWLYPFSDMDFFMFDVPSKYDWWVWNFVFHWTFLFEVILVVYAVYIFTNKKNIKQDMIDYSLARKEKS